MFQQTADYLNHLSRKTSQPVEKVLDKLIIKEEILLHHP